MRLLSVGVPLYGHVLPLMPVVRAFRDRGDAVAVAVPASLVHLFADEDLRVFATGPEPSEIQAEVLRRTGVDVTDHSGEASEARGDAEAEAFTGARIDLTVTDVLSVAQEWRPDVLVGDAYDYVSLVAGAILDLPVVHVSTGVEVKPSFEQRLQANAAQWCAAEGLTLGRPEWLLDTWPRVLRADDWRPPTEWTPMSPVVDSARSGLARGPVPHRPTVLVTFGTIFGTPTVLDPILRELSTLDVALRVTLGPEASSSDFAVGPERVTFEPFAPLADLLTNVDLVVAHGGGGTTLGVLASAIPLVLAPQGADQFTVSERVAAAGAGVRILPGPTAPREIGSAVATVLADEHFRDNAHTVAQHIAAMPSPAQVIETIASSVR